MRSQSSTLLDRDLILDHCWQGLPKQACKGWTGEARFLGNRKDFTWVSARGQGRSPVPWAPPGPPALQHSSGRGSPGVSPHPGQQHSCSEVTTVSPSPKPQRGGGECDLRNYEEPRREPPASSHAGRWLRDSSLCRHGQEGPLSKARSQSCRRELRGWGPGAARTSVTPPLSSLSPTPPVTPSHSLHRR